MENEIDPGHIQGEHPADRIWQELRSAFVVDPSRSDRQWSSCNYQLGQLVSGSATRIATRAHTNQPTSGALGLPEGWRKLVYAWRASTNMQLTDEVLDWAAHTTVRFYYNGKTYPEGLLVDLLLSRTPIGSPMRDLPIDIRQQLEYGVEVVSEDENSLVRLRSSLSHDLTCWIHLEGPLIRPLF